MRIVSEKSEKYHYQLTDYLPKKSMLESYVAPFKQYNEEHRAVIVQNKEGYAIFTDGGERTEGVQ